MDATLLPIDIHSNKLTDWLITRRVCQRQWLRDVTEARKRLHELSQSDMDKQGVDLELQAALQQPHVHYWHCEQIADALKKIESANKSVLFGYSSTVIKELDAILKVFRRSNCYLADASRLLNKLVQEEAPYLRRQIERQRRRQTECERKRGEHAAAGAEAKAKFLSLCKQLGLTQQMDLRQVREDLMSQADQLPRWYDTDCTRALQQLAPGLKLYNSVVQLTVNKDLQLCPVLARVISNGNCTQYELLHQKAPVSVEEFKLQVPPELLAEFQQHEVILQQQQNQQQQQKEADVEAGADEVINWDEGDAIDFGIDEISIVDDDASQQEEQSANPEAGDGVARGELARSLLDCRDTRELLLDDLHELAAFLGRLQSEREDHGNSIAQSQLSAWPADVQAANCKQLVQLVQAAITLLTEPSRQHAMLIRASPACLSRLLGRFRSLLEQSAKAAAAGRLCDLRQQEAVEEEQMLLQQQATLRQQLADLKQRIQADISRRHDNRRVNIMGEINAV